MTAGTRVSQLLYCVCFTTPVVSTPSRIRRNISSLFHPSIIRRSFIHVYFIAPVIRTKKKENAKRSIYFFGDTKVQRLLNWNANKNEEKNILNDTFWLLLAVRVERV